MIGLLLRASGFGGDADGCLAIVLACCIGFGLYKCSHFRLRDCLCLKWCLRASGTDRFEDFELFLVVHEVIFTAATDMATVVRVSAGDQVVATEPNKRWFQQPLSILIEQGTETLEVDIMKPSGKKRLGTLALDIMDILETKGGYTERVFSVKSCHHGFVNPKVKLSIHLSESDEEMGLLGSIEVSEDHAGMMVQNHLRRVQQATSVRTDNPIEDRFSESELLSSACSGHLELLTSWGNKDKVWVLVKQVKGKKPFLGIWKERQEQEHGKEPEYRIELLKVKSVQAHPTQDACFLINEAIKHGPPRQHQFYRLDRSRDVWVQTLSLLIAQLRKKKGEGRK
mmetsp:Transcript_130024/g.324069  ORF Transcript_130024/g.324069 Transcript_130024/m.324069 type:complete len:340 (+) Transcript_130024:77-1096(+)